MIRRAPFLRIRIGGANLGIFISPGPKGPCPPGKGCPEGTEMYCFPTPKNRNVCVLRLKKEYVSRYREPGECLYLVRDKKTGRVEECTRSQVRAGRPAACAEGPDRQVFRICPPQRRLPWYEPVIREDKIVPIRRRE